MKSTHVLSYLLSTAQPPTRVRRHYRREMETQKRIKLFLKAGNKLKSKKLGCINSNVARKDRGGTKGVKRKHRAHALLITEDIGGERY